MKIGVIGGGLSGLGIAALLSKNGFEVEIHEKNETLGGRARQLNENVYKFDMGPSWFLMPDIFEEFFKEFEVDIYEKLKLQKLNPAYRIYFDKEEYIDIPDNLEDIKRLFESIEPGSGKKLDEYLKKAKEYYEISKKYILNKSFDSWTSFIDFGLMKNSLKLNFTENFHDYVSKYFKNEKIQKILEYSIVFLGSSPKKTPAFYSMINYIDYNLGVWYPKGGIFEIVMLLKKIILKNGGSIVTNSEIAEIKINNKKITKLQSNKGEFDYDIVINSGDYQYFEQNILPEEFRNYSKKYWENRDVSPSAFLIYLGLDKKLKNLEHHTLLLHNDWMGHFDQILDKKKYASKPSVYICTPSITDQIVAPKSKENLFILVPIPADPSETDKQIKSYRDKIIQEVEKIIGEKFEENIEFERIFSSKDFKKDYNAFRGSALGIAHTLSQSTIFRPKHKNKKINNLYYTGQYTHPGIGMPMVLLSAKLVSNEITKKYN